MSKIIPCSLSYNIDEPCLSLKELNLLTPDKKEIHRWQILKVIRDDKIVEIRIDMGKENPRQRQFLIPGGVVKDRIGFIEHTVAELQELADLERNSPMFKDEDVPELRAWREHKDKTQSVIFS